MLRNDLEFRVPAAEMFDRVQRFRQAFVKNYMEPPAPYPVAVCLVEAGIKPRTQEQLDLLLSLAPLTNENDALHGSTGGIVVAPEFEFLLAGQMGIVTVFVPDDIEIRVAHTETELVFSAETPFGVQVSGGIQIGGVPFPTSVLELREIAIDESGVRYRLIQTKGQAQRIDIVLDFHPTRMDYSMAGALKALVVRLASDAGPCTGTPGGGGVGDPSTGIKQQTICADTPIPDGWIKVNTANDASVCGFPSDPRLQNVWIIEKYEERPIGTRMTVCADRPRFPSGQDVPTGWIVKGRHNDPAGCGKPVDTPGVLNMMTIERIE
ncbi:MAG: hypothetical protein C5B51_28120 [Terriglobia bacterium]|nr:MAG: hypothetical protein C5B51_28120 [Terriglobia bacterium]